MRVFPCIAVALAASIVAGTMGGLGWPFELFASLLPQFLLAALLLGGAGLLLRRQGRQALLLWAAALLALFGAREQFFPAGPPVADPGLRLVWANMGNDRDMRSFARLMALARSVQADMVIASEFPERLSEPEALRESSGFPHILGRPAGARTNIAVFSRTPVEAIGSVSERWNSGFLLAVPGMAAPLTVAAVHTPTPLLPANMSRRDEIVRDIAGVLSAGAGAAVLVGDFNAVSWSPLLRSLARQGGRRASYGLRASWRSSWPLLGLPIDQVFAFGAAQASARVGGDIGSDHFPLLVDVAVGGRP